MMMARAEAAVVILLLLLLIADSCVVSTRATTAEGDALFAIMGKWSVNFPSWRGGGDPCLNFWDYVKCSSDGHVVALNVSNTGITGEVPAEIATLELLEVLDLSNADKPRKDGNKTVLNNTLSGFLPDSLRSLRHLRSLNLSNIGWNMGFPLVVTKIASLEEFYMSKANLTGEIPEEFYNLVNLQAIFLGGNKLTGSLKGFAEFQNIVQMTLWDNNFHQTIPDEFGDLSSLQYFNCHDCNLYGALPESFSKLKNLQNLTLHQNQLTGPIPESWKSITTMRNLRLDANFLSGRFPEWVFDSWPLLDSLYISKNRFAGQFPNIQELDDAYNISYRMNYLRLDCNYMEGQTPCKSTPCSTLIETKLNATDDATFDFIPNCFSDSSDTDKNKVKGNCGESHPKLTCEEVTTLLLSRCLPCPAGQSVIGPGLSCICGTPEGKRNEVVIRAVVGAATAAVIVFFVFIAFLIYKRRKRVPFVDMFSVDQPKGDTHWEAPPGVQRFTLNELGKCTGDFSDANMIGQGGFGKVFVGNLDDGRTVAIKRATANGLQGMGEFQNEVSLLSRLHHRHLVKLEGFCDDGGYQILVYEFMKKGNLHVHLLGQTTTPLHWYKRLEIAYGVAQGLEYLHSFADPPVIHRDVKPSNILLDENMVAKLADFGISKVSPEFETHISTRPAGTAGYLDPDYFMRRQLTTASDVYAFGVVLLELVTGQEAIDPKRLDNQNLVEWVRKRYASSGIEAIIDPVMQHNCPLDVMISITELGLLSASFDRLQRPTMKVVLATLEPLMVAESLHSDDKGSQSRIESKGVGDLSISFDSNSQGDHTSQSKSSDVGTNLCLLSNYPGPR